MVGPINKDQMILRFNGQGGAPAGVPFFKKDNSNKQTCDLCKKYFACLTPQNFKNIVWIQDETFQRISKNDLIKRFELDLCYDCNKRVFAGSVPCINFSQQLFNALSEVRKNG